MSAVVNVAGGADKMNLHAGAVVSTGSSQQRLLGLNPSSPSFCGLPPQSTDVQL